MIFKIENYSHNCYLNVIIQILLLHKKTSNIIAHYVMFQKNLIKPQKLIDLLGTKININMQNDAQETLTILFDLIPQLEQYFTTKVLYQYKCSVCNDKRKVNDVINTFYVYKDTLEECLIDFIKEEKYTLKCDKCNMNTETTKCSYIDTLGDILIFYNIMKKKLNLNRVINFKESKYILTGFVMHYGSQHGGHYTFVHYEKQVIIDDTRISKMNQINNHNIYLIVFVKQD